MAMFYIDIANAEKLRMSAPKATNDHDKFTNLETQVDDLFDDLEG